MRRMYPANLGLDFCSESCLILMYRRKHSVLKNCKIHESEIQMGEEKGALVFHACKKKKTLPECNICIHPFFKKKSTFISAILKLLYG